MWHITLAGRDPRISLGEAIKDQYAWSFDQQMVSNQTQNPLFCPPLQLQIDRNHLIISSRPPCRRQTQQ